MGDMSPIPAEVDPRGNANGGENITQSREILVQYLDHVVPIAHREDHPMTILIEKFRRRALRNQWGRDFTFLYNNITIGSFDTPVSLNMEEPFIITAILQNP